MILDDMYKLNPGSIITLYVLDNTGYTGRDGTPGSITYIHAGLNELKTQVQWQNNTYQPFPIEFKGISRSSQGTQARPTVKIANVNGMMGSLVYNFHDLIGATFTKKKTLVQYLDAANFAIDPLTSNPDIYWPDETYVINRKTSENKIMIEWELATRWEVFKIGLPARKIVSNACWWDYGDTSCGYVNTDPPWYDVAGDEVLTKAEDKCGKRLTSCKLRFDPDPSTGLTLPFGAFVSAGRIY